MKKIIILLVAVALAACGTQKKTTTNTNVQKPSSASIPVEEDEIIDEVIESTETEEIFKRDASGNLSGYVDKIAFMQEPFNSWFNSRMAAYQPDSDTIDALKVALEGTTIRAYMGTWCGDSKRETPQFYKILEEADYDLINVAMITVDRSKKQPEKLVSEYDVLRVPTFIFYRDGVEIGRYVERPRESLEKDMLKIVTGQPYKHSYEN